jgi:chemotaxis protein CheX
MPETLQITDALIHDCIVTAVQSVFRTMACHEVTFVEKTSLPAEASEEQMEVMGSVGFVGVANGLIYLRLTEAFARIATGQILGMSPGEVEMNGPEVVNDAIGEVTNMTVGSFKNTLCDLGAPCKLTLPTIVRGNQLSVASIKSATRHIFHFDCKGHRIVADIQIKID